MKVLFIIPSLKGGGQERAGMLLCNYLLQYHDVTAVCFEAAQPDEYNYQCPIIRLPIATSPGIVAKGFAGVKRIAALKKIKQKIKPHVSIAFGNTAIILNSLSANGEKKIASIRQSFSVIKKDNSLPGRLHMQLYLWAVRNAEYIVPVSDAINKELKGYFNISNKCFINNGIDAAAVATLAELPGAALPGNRKWLVHSGRFDRSKGHWHLVKIFARVRQTVPEAGLILLGSSDEHPGVHLSIASYCKDFLETEKISWATEANSPVDVLFLGHVNNPFRIIKQCAVFVFPSLWEGFPNALLEAMCCGIPVIAADCATGPADIINEGGEQFGVLLPAFKDYFPQVEESGELTRIWADAIIGLLQEPTRITHFAKQSLLRSSAFAEKTIGDKWLSLLHEAAGK